MKRTGIFTGLFMAALLIAAMPVYAVKTVDMPKDFGSNAWVAGHWSEAVGYLKYMVKNDAREELLKLPESERLDAWDSFWKTNDPDKGDAMKQRREQYFERIRYANENFGTILQPGWLTEMGEAWIRLGKPDWSDHYTMRGAGRDMVVWNYISPRDTYLVFLDRTGVGDYDLLNYYDMIDEVYLYN